MLLQQDRNIHEYSTFGKGQWEDTLRFLMNYAAHRIMEKPILCLYLLCVYTTFYQYGSRADLLRECVCSQRAPSRIYALTFTKRRKGIS